MENNNTNDAKYEGQTKGILNKLNKTKSFKITSMKSLMIITHQHQMTCAQ